MPIKRRLLLTLTLFVFIPFLIFCFSISYVSGTLVREEVLSSAEQMVRNTAYTLSARLSEMRSAVNIASSHKSILDAIMHHQDHAPVPSLSTILQDARDIEQTFASLTVVHRLYRMRIYLPGDSILVGQRYHYFSLDAVRDEGWARRILGAYGTTVLFQHEFTYVYNDTRSLLTVARSAPGSERFPGSNAIIAADLDLSEIQGILRNAHLVPGSAIALVDGSGRVTTQYGMEDRGLAMERLEGAEKGWQDYGPDHLLFVSPDVYPGGWHVAVIMDEGELLAPILQAAQTMAILAVPMAVLLYLVTLLATRVNIGRIQIIAKEMERVMKGDFTVRVSITDDNEIGLLERAFNYLVAAVSDLIDTTVRDKEELMRHELRTLQAQIQPHFLYNTLDLVRWRALASGDRQAAHIIEMLARFYRIGLSRGRDRIGLADEFEHARLYVQIQQFRMDRMKLTARFDLPEEYRGMPVPGNLLQPLVENAILHGIMEKETQSGEVIVAARREGEDLLISVSDDGIGMSPERMASILREDDPRRAGYGAWNVHRRLRLAYGEGYGLRYEARPGGGTVATLRLPARDARR